jgi:peptidyl-prolyl cis-trans isomerase A (cyclophilin A)
MRSLWLFILFAMVFAVLLVASCNENDSKDDGSAVTYDQKQPIDRASPTDSDVAKPTDGTESTDSAADGETTDGSESTSGATDSGSTSGDSATGSTDTTDSEEGMTPESNKDGNVVVLETTKGNIVIQLHEDWSPLGVAHFKELVSAKFYDGAPWFRVIDGFVAQCGVSADPKMNDEWSEKTIKDEPVVKGNLRGTVVYGKTGMPDSRSTHFFINFVDNSASLDRQGFSAFGEVTEGMDIADSLTRCEYADQGGLAGPGGIDKFKSRFPSADYIKRAYLK